LNRNKYLIPYQKLKIKNTVLMILQNNLKRLKRAFCKQILWLPRTPFHLVSPERKHLVDLLLKQPIPDVDTKCWRQ
jgi:hypothetical protein